MLTFNRTYMNQRSRVKYSAIFFVIIGVLLCNATSVYADLQKTEQKKATEANITFNNNDICLTPGCINSANVILKNMDRSVEPCDNFYKFACGGFLNSAAIPDDASQIDGFATYDEKITQQLRLIYDGITARNQTKHLRLAKNLYDSCMNTSRIETDGLTPLKKILKKLGGWPVLEGDTWIDENFDWINTSSQFHNAGYSSNYVISFNINMDMKNTSRRIIYLQYADVDLDNLITNSNLKDYYRYMVDTAVDLGGDRDRVERELKSSLRFEMKLSNLIIKDAKSHILKAENMYTVTTLGQLVNNYSSIAWKKWFAALLPSTTILTENETIGLASPNYITHLLELLANTSKRAVANYMFWRVVKTSNLYLNEQIRNRSFVLTSGILGQPNRSVRWKECVSIVTNSLPISAGALYVKNYFTEDAKAAAVEITANVKTAWRSIIKTVDWMDNATKKSALEKVDMMNSHVAYPDEFWNDTEVDAYYQNIELTGGNFLESGLNVSLFQILKEYSSLRLPADKDDWTLYGNAAVVNAFYSRLHNAITIPAGVLQGIYFSSDRPSYLNYGGIGSIIGHEITHGFDDVGSEFGKNGNIVDWWDPATKANFDERAECILNQYNNYIVKLDGKNATNGEFKQGENLADNEGLKQAHHAYITWAQANKPEQSLPGLPYTPRQMFWISRANVWCTKTRPKTENYLINNDSHSLSEFRVNGPLSNSVEFSKDFNCPVGSEMNPVNKCVMW